MDSPIYLDHNATTPMLPAVIEAMRACYAEPCLNPASQHEFGRRARRRLEDARERIGELVGAKTSGRDADTLLFTSGGTESNNLAIHSVTVDRPPGRLVISDLEHPSITSLTDRLARTGWEIDRLSVDRRGLFRVDDLPYLLRSDTSRLRPDTAAVCAILGQNETGVLQPVAEIAAIAREHQVPLHTDATQVVGKLPVDFRALGAATMTFAAHKFHGPLGIGALVVRHGVTLAPQFFGGFQQAGLRPGTESVALVVGMLTALELWHAEQAERIARLTALRDELERAILRRLARRDRHRRRRSPPAADVEHRAGRSRPAGVVHRARPGRHRLLNRLRLRERLERTLAGAGGDGPRPGRRFERIAV